MSLETKELLKYSYKNKLAHIPSALSMAPYINAVFNTRVTKDDIIVIGKPFGSQAYYLTWKKLGWIDDIESLSVGVKHDEIDFVDYSEETIGNALGVAIGLALANPNKLVYVNLSDGALQMGNTLEAIQFIGHNNIKNIFVTVDMNNYQVTGKTTDIIDVAPVMKLCEEYSWQVGGVTGFYKDILETYFKSMTFIGKPKIVFISTIKGYEVPSMTKDPVKWHYKKLEPEDMV